MAGAWEAFGGMGAMLSHLAHLQKLAMAQNAETSPRFERAQSAEWSQLAGSRGDPEAIKNDLRILNRGSSRNSPGARRATNGRSSRYPPSQFMGLGENATAHEAVAGVRRIATERRRGPTARDRIADPIGTKKKKKVKNARTKKKTKKRKRTSEP